MTVLDVTKPDPATTGNRLQDCFAGQLSNPTDKPPGQNLQAEIAPLRREVAELYFRIAAVKLICAANNIAIGDDIAAEGDREIAGKRFREGDALLLEMGAP